MSARPRINWFSPLPPTRSDIARQTWTLLPELGARADVMVWSNDSGFDQIAVEGVTISRYEAAHPPWREINQADATFYQIGNDPRYHEDIWRVSRQHPGIVILHDLKLQHLFAGLVTETKTLTRAEFLELMETHHATAGRLQAEFFLRGGITVDDLAEEFPLVGAAIHRALGAIVHSELAQDFLAETTSIPAAYLCLPAARPAPVDNSFLQERVWNEAPYRVIMFGFLGPNRRLPAILKALARLPERARFRLDIYGTMEGAEKIMQLACRLELSELVRWHGFATEEELARALERSHLAINLRYPSMGEASGGQLHCWQYALPTLVSQTAWYSTLPPETVGFVRPEHEIDDIQTHLSAFLEEPARYRTMGENGRAFVSQHCTTRRYADGIMEIVARVPELQSTWIARHLAEHAGTIKRTWSGQGGNGLSSVVPREIEGLIRGRR